MNTFAVYDVDTGRIVQTMSAITAADASMCAAVRQAVMAVAGDVRDNTHYIVAGQPVSVPPQPSPAHTWIWATHGWADARTIAQIRAAQVAILEAAYAVAISQPVTYTSRAGVAGQYQADPDSINNVAKMQLAFAGAASTPIGFYWLTSDNTQVSFFYADIQGLAAVLGRQGFGAFQTLQTQKSAVRAATTAAAVAAITWP